MSRTPVSARPRRALSGVIAAALPAAMLVVATPSAQADPAATFTWKVSQQYVDHFSPAAWNQSTLEASDGATLTDDKETVFTEGTGGFDLATGDGTASYTGTVTGTFRVGVPQYSVAISDPEVTVEDGKGEIRADVAWTVPVEDQEGSSEDVLVTTFDATDDSWSGAMLSATPHFADVLPAGSEEATALGLPADQPIGGQSFAHEFLEALGSGVRAHFHASGGSGDPKKAPAPFAAVVPEKEVAAEPSATATVTQADDEGLKINVKGKDYSGESPGIYVGLTEAGPIDPADASSYLGTVWLPAGSIVDGAFDTDLALITPDEIADLDPEADYEVHTQKAHGQSAQDPSQNARIPVDIDFSVWDEDDSEEPEPEGPAETTITADDVETTYGKHTTVTAEVGDGARGRVSVRLGGETKSGWVKDGTVSFVVPRDLTARIYTARWNFLGNDDFAPSTVASKVILRSAPTTPSARFTAPETRKGGRADLTVAKADGTTWPSPTGTVKLRLSRADGRSITHTRTLRWGRTHVTLPQMGQGTWKAEVIYDGAATTFVRSSTTTSMRVAR